MKKQFINALAITTLSAFLWSCNQKDPAPKGDYVSGVFVINEGNFSQNNGSLSFFTREQKEANNDIFLTESGSPLKGSVSGFATAGDVSIALVDNSAAGLDKAEIVNSNTFEKIATIGAPDIENPRDVVIISSSKAYVSCWGVTGTYPDFFINPGYIAVVDLTTNKVTKKIPAPKGVENMTFTNGKLFAGTVDYSGSNILTVVNTATDEVAKEVVFNVSPNPFGVDANGKVWINAGLEAIRIAADSYAVEATLPVGSDASKTANYFTFDAEKKTIFFGLSSDFGTSGQTFKFAITDSQINLTTPFIKRYFAGLAADPMQGLLYAAVSPSFAQSGYAVRYRTDGNVIDSVKVGIGPTGFVFK